jgi:hypothetical protein
MENLSLESIGKTTVGTGFNYALFYELDEILVSEGKNRYFVFKMKEAAKSTGINNLLKKTLLEKLGVTDAAESASSKSVKEAFFVFKNIRNYECY